MWTYILLALIGGIAIATQAPINAKLREIVVSPVMSALISFAIGTIALFVMHLTGFAGPASFDRILKMPWWYWIGGVLGAFYVFAALTSVSKLGAATVVSLVIVGQLIAALAIDSFGLFGMPVIAISWQRICGIIFLVLGAYLMKQRVLPIE
ncbi:DMT family transporter [bacterium]|nr:DMT family transporter [bacterium]QQR56233.1 MAG: DMT family transporter [Candidatus Melainabacteria bacterium]